MSRQGAIVTLHFYIKWVFTNLEKCLFPILAMPNYNFCRIYLITRLNGMFKDAEQNGYVGKF